MKTSVFFLLVTVALQHSVLAQGDPPFVSPEEQKAVEAQNDEFNRALAPSLTEASKSTVRVWSGKRRLAYGTVVGDGRKILTKWSEVARAAANLRVESSNGDVFQATLAGVYDDEDLAVLEVKESGLTAVRWSKDPLRLGSFLIASQPDGKSAGFGVVSVMERNLRDQDQAYLGVVGAINHRGAGVLVEEIDPDSGAARAGLKPGQLILKVGERGVSGVLELRNALVGTKPGEKVVLQVDGGNGATPVEVVLGNRPELPKFSPDRLRQMDHMGTRTSRVGESFGNVLQTDMRLEPEQVGGPVANLNGKVVGITMARAGRTKSYVMASEDVMRLLKQEPKDPMLVMNRRDQGLAEMPRQRMAPANPGRAQGRMRQMNPERMKRQMEEMQRLLDFMREEMEGLEEER